MNNNSANWKYLNTIAILFYKKKDNIHFWYLNTTYFLILNSGSIKLDAAAGNSDSKL